MKKIINNKYDLKEEDITETVVRVKILLINSNNELLLAYSNNEYHFIGGHVEDGENLNEAIKREIKEETGIVLENTNLEPFAVSYGYWKDWPEEGKNRKTEIYFYEIFSDEKPNLENTNYTEHEKAGRFELRYIELSEIEDVIRKNVEEYGDKHSIAKEMLELFSIYKG